MGTFCGLKNLHKVKEGALGEAGASAEARSAVECSLHSSGVGDLPGLTVPAPTGGTALGLAQA